MSNGCGGARLQRRDLRDLEVERRTLLTLHAAAVQVLHASEREQLLLSTRAVAVTIVSPGLVSVCLGCCAITRGWRRECEERMASVLREGMPLSCEYSCSVFYKQIAKSYTYNWLRLGWSGGGVGWDGMDCRGTTSSAACSEHSECTSPPALQTDHSATRHAVQAGGNGASRTRASASQLRSLHREGTTRRRVRSQSHLPLVCAITVATGAWLRAAATAIGTGTAWCKRRDPHRRRTLSDGI